MRRSVLLLILLWGCATAALAQAPRGDQGGLTSTVSGRVYCADTNVPARMATVVLQPAEAVDAFSSGKSVSTVAEGVQTLLDGSFFIPNVVPGTYYVIASLPGYVSPMAPFMALSLAKIRSRR
jgi:hypothetical protein